MNHHNSLRTEGKSDIVKPISLRIMQSTNNQDTNTQPNCGEKVEDRIPHLWKL